MKGELRPPGQPEGSQCLNSNGPRFRLDTTSGINRLVNRHSLEADVRYGVKE